MVNEIISYLEMCQREGVNLQRGMNYQLRKGYSVILMSVHVNAPYTDRFEDNGSTLIYEGHDVYQREGISSPKTIDQPEFNHSGTLTENGKFNQAAQEFKRGLRQPERVRVYEKIRPGIWSYNGVFELVDSWQEYDGQRQVFKFKLIPFEESESQIFLSQPAEHRRIIPTSVKLEVWKRDGGKCVICGATTDLHYDHIIPYSKGGTSIKAENIQLLCARHNLEKRDKIE